MHADMSFVVTYKLGYPPNPEGAFGALSEVGRLFIFDKARKNIPSNIIE